MKLAMDIGGTHIRYQTSINGDKWSDLVVIKWFDGLEPLFKNMMSINPRIKEVGISFAGQVHDGIIESAPNINQHEPIDVTKWFADRGVVARIDNDLKCAAIAESAYFDEGEMFVIYVGTGFGTAFIKSNRRPLAGSHNLAGECGHVPYKKAPFKCGCGKDNCIELYCSGSGLKKHREYYGLNDLDTLAKLEESNNINAMEIVRNFKEALVVGTAVGIALYNPLRVVFGGGVIHKNPELIDVVQANIGMYAPAFALKETIFMRSELEEGALEGAKELLRRD